MEDDMDAFFNFSFISDNLTFLINSTYDFYSPNVSTIALIPFIIVCLVGLLGNVLVLSIIFWSKKMWRTMNVFVFCLALGDLLYMLCLLILVIELMSPLGTFLCILYWILTALTTFSNVYFLAIMSISVFLQMYFPALSKKLSIKVAALTSLGIWITSLLLAIPFFIYANVDEYSNCLIHWPDSIWNIIFTSYRFALAFLAPLILITVFLILTQCRVRRQDQTMDSTVTIVKEDMVMIMVLSLIFIIFWLPTHVLEIMSGLTSDGQFSDGSYYAISIVPYLKSCVYPFVYGFLSRGFKHWYNRIFCCKKVHEGDDPPKNSNERQEDKSTAC
ncbi:somatostatin receptor type 5-like [Bufo bufo]|uniref:somatostatin receptor type 5-like n=1 Tax=Bufo bufo TaxID=8384 RepID=UPI001ABDE39E|nr:somatostatin receptor type 5-like [Bufo bufo]XP_040296012.1 somatostatin receptor type 5-like [Bufo bufo]XP_040296013.1 somatostatin receptor type 5-like [Bufo bufo]